MTSPLTQTIVKHLLVLMASTSAWVAAQPATEPILPLPQAVTDVDPAKVRLGAKLFADTRLSGDGKVSCQSCHQPNEGLSDRRRHSIGAFGASRALNSQTLLNVRFLQSGLNWTGRQASIERQIVTGIANKDSMSHSWPIVVETLLKDAPLVAEFAATYGGENPLSEKNMQHAIVEFEKSLVTPSRFDDFLRGDVSAITADEKRGYDLFKSTGCAACHNGIMAGGSSFQKFPLIGDYYVERKALGRGEINEVDKGVYFGTKKDEDMFKWRVAPLRNITLTAPYFHDGAVPTLDEAIQLMGRHQLGKEIPLQERQLIAKFLATLTGKELDKAGKSK
jgi:cytochrome c peroxidase